MIEIIPYTSPLSLETSFKAGEFSIPRVGMDELASGMGRYGIFNALVNHQQEQGFVPENQVWAGIDARSLVVRRTLFSDLNPQADPVKLNENFFATQLAHWRSILGEVKYSPFTYIYKGILRGDNEYPAVVGFDRSKLISFDMDDENIIWKPAAGETVESALQSIYYFDSLFPKVDSAPNSGFDIPAHLVPEDPKALLAMLDFLNEANTGYTYQKAREVWAEAAYPDGVMSILDSWAQTVKDYFRENPTDTSFDFKTRGVLWKRDLEELLGYEEDELHKMIDAFNESFFGSNPHKFELVESTDGLGMTILGKNLFNTNQ